MMRLLLADQFMKIGVRFLALGLRVLGIKSLGVMIQLYPISDGKLAPIDFPSLGDAADVPASPRLH